MVLLTALWFGTALASAGPGLLLLSFAESRLASSAAMALLLAAIVAAGSGVACALGVTRPLVMASLSVVMLCSAALVVLEVDGRVSPGGFVLLGGAAVALAVLAGALTRRGPSR